MDKKGQVSGWFGTALAIALGVITIAVVVIILAAFQSSQTANSLAYNIVGDGLTFADNATSQFATAGTVLGALLLLALIGGGAYLANKYK